MQAVPCVYRGKHLAALRPGNICVQTWSPDTRGLCTGQTEWLCTKSNSTSPLSGRLIVARQFTAGMQAKEIQSVSGRLKTDCSTSTVSVVRFTDFAARWFVSQR